MQVKVLQGPRPLSLTLGVPTACQVRSALCFKKENKRRERESERENFIRRAEKEEEEEEERRSYQDLEALDE